MGFIADESLVKFYRAAGLIEKPASIMPGLTTYMDGSYRHVTRLVNVDAAPGDEDARDTFKRLDSL